MIKTYREQENGHLFHSPAPGTSQSIPPDHHEFQRVLAEVEAGTAEIIPHDSTPPPETALQIETAIRSHFDGKAREFGFASTIEAVTYADEPMHATYQEYGTALRAWRSECWMKYGELKADGEVRTSAEIIALLPELSITAAEE